MPNDLPNVSATLPEPAPSVTDGMLSAAQLQAPLANIPQPAAPIKYTPSAQELASAEPVAPIKYTPTPQELESAQPVPAPNVFEVMTPDQMVSEAKANPKTFDPISAFQALPADKKAEFFDKAANTYHQLRMAGHFVPSMMDMLKNAGKGVADLAKTGAILANIGVESPVTLPTAVASGVTGTPLDTSTFTGALTKQAQQESGEFLAGQKVAALGFGQMLLKGAQWAARGMHLTKPLTDYTPDDKLHAFATELATRNGMAKLMKEGIAPGVAEQLSKEGYGLRPEKVETTASGSPFAWEGAGKLFGVATRTLSESAAPLLATIAGDTSPAGLATAEAVVHSIPAAASDLSARAVGRTLQALSRAGEKVAEHVEPIVKPISQAAGAVGGAFAGHHIAGPWSIPLGIAEGISKGGELGEKIATGVGKAAVRFDKLADVGKAIATGEGVKGSATQLARDIAQGAPGALAQVGTGAALDVGLGAATTETPGERANVTPFGTIFGAAGAARSMGGRAVSGYIIAPRAWGSEGTPKRPENFSSNFPALNAEHTDAMASASDGVQQRFNAVQKFLNGAAPGTELVYAPRPEAGKPDTLPQTLQESGINPDFADQDGFSATVKGADGNNHKIVVVRNMEAAPHEARHAMDDVIGASAVEDLNATAKKEFADKWDAFKQQYADRLTPTGLPTSDPDGTILRESGYGNAAAKEKIIAQTRDALVQEGQNPTEEQVKDAAANAIRAEQGRAQQAGQELWQTVLTPEEQSHQVDQYIGGEIRAEHHDAWFKAGQPGTLRGKMGMFGARVLQALGINPLEGRSSEYGTPLEGSLVTQAKKTSPKVEMPPEAPAAEGTPAAQQQAVRNAQKAQAEASNLAVPGALKTPKEVLGVIAEAIARKQGVKLTGLFAPDEPAASLTSDRETRRAMIEAYRSMPDAAKKLWGKLFYPENVPVTGRGGNLQIFGWSPEVFAANAHKVAGALNSLADKGVNLSPYELDPVSKTFTEQGWKDLYDDVQKYVQNQMAGRTGSGLPLVVPEPVTRAGAAAPPVRGETSPLPQDRADFINALFNARLPDTGLARQGAINMPLNLAGQKISEATLPGRVESPVEPRGTFRGAVAARQGVKGEPIMEVNPFRNQFEAALKQAGIEKPSLIEVNQRLNLKNIKDVELAPEQGQFRANTLTLQAGFQPKRLPITSTAGTGAESNQEFVESHITGDRYDPVFYGSGDAYGTAGIKKAARWRDIADLMDRNQLIDENRPEVSAVEDAKDRARVASGFYHNPTVMDKLKNAAHLALNPGDQEAWQKAGFQPAKSAGAGKDELAAAQKEWTDKGTDSRYFKNWFGDSKVVDNEGKPLLLYHGTTHEFSKFGTERGNPENFWGVGHYFTTDENDAISNYSHEGGADLSNRIESRIDHIMNEGKPRNVASRQARKELLGKVEKVIPAYVKLENPLIDSPKGDGTRFDYNYDEDTHQETGSAIDLYNSIMSTAPEFGIDGQAVWNEITRENGMEDLDAYHVSRTIKASPDLLDSYDDKGQSLGPEFMRRVFENMGFDGIIQKHVPEQFTRMGIAPDAQHVVAFRADQVKSADNRGTFNPQDERFAFQPAKSAHELADFLDKTPPEDYAAAVHGYKGRYGGGQSGMSFDIGATIKTPEELARLNASRAKFETLSKAALAAKDYPAATDAASKAQAAREAVEAATDSGGAGDFIRKYYDPEFKGSPLHQSAPADLVTKAQFMHSLEGIKKMNDDEVARQMRGMAETETARNSSYAGNPDMGIVLHSAKLRSTAFLKPGPDAEKFEKSWNESKDVAARNHLVESYFDQPVQFQPSSNPRAIQAAAVRDPKTEEIFSGPVHLIAYSNAIANGADPLRLGKFEEGFVTNSGEWLSRDQGRARAEELNQLNPAAAARDLIAAQRGTGHRSLISEDVNFQPAKKDKEIELRHWSNVPGLKVLDPAFHGTGLTGEERARARDYAKIYVPRTYFGTKNYSKEGNLGPEQYRAFVKSKNLYPFQEDPKDLWPSPDEVEAAGYAPMDSRAANTLYENKIANAGYEGYIHRDAKVAAKFTKTPVQYVGREGKAHFQPKNGPDYKELDWRDLGNDALDPGLHIEARAGMPPNVTVEQLQKEGFQSVDYNDNGSFHDYDNNAIFYKDSKKGRFPLTKDGLMDASKAASRAFTEAQKLAFEDLYGPEGTAQFSPSANPRGIAWAAIKDPEGGVWESRLHILAMGKYWDKHRDLSMDDISKFPQGFTTNEGEFLTREQALERAKETGQLIRTPKEELHSTAVRFQPKLPAPKPEEFAHEDTIEAALAKPNWAILTATQEKLGAGTDKVNEDANEKLHADLSKAGYTPIEVKGSYKGVDQGRNFLVTGMTPEAALAFGRKYNQDSVLTPQGLLYSDGSIQPPDATQNKIGKAAEGEDFFSRVENGPAFSMGFDEKIKPQQSEQLLGDLGTKKPLSSKQVGDMTKAQLAAHYPESVIPKAKDDLIPSDIVNSPLAKEAGSREAAVKAFSSKLVDFARSMEKSNGYQSGLKWYSEFVPKLKKVYGKHAQIMAELLAATSPNNAPDTNFAFANDALEGYISGRFDKKIAKFEQGLKKIEDGSWEKYKDSKTEADFLAKWITDYDLQPRQSNGQLYGMHSVPVLRVFARKWLERTSGPKTQNFVKNLLGTGHDATIDVWADRTMRRLGYADYKARWRILPKNGTGVSDSDFAFSQDAFRDAANQLGVTPDALQGGLWFAEKQLWAENGWGRLDLGDYRKEIAKADLLKSGITQRLAVQKAKAKTVAAEQPELLVSPRP